MKEQLISFKTAKLSKEKGFTGYKSHVFYYKTGELYTKGNESFCEDWNTWSYTDGVRWASPPQSLLQKWLRETHGIHISIHYMDDVLLYGWQITTIVDNTDMNVVYSRYDYEQALEAGLIEALKLIK